MNATVRRLVLGTEARVLRRELGVTAWAVLEDLLTGATGTGPELVVCSNVRRVADQLGVSKDTAARSLNRLIRAGIVARAVVTRNSAGAFAAGSYVVNVEHLAGVLDHAHRQPRDRAKRLRSQRARTHDQLTLIDLIDPAS